MPKDKRDDLRQPAEILFAEELDALIKTEKHPVPAGWRMSPRSVHTYICGGKCGKLDVTPKYIGHPRLVEIAISTLVTDRALLLIGEPGTAKSWLSEHLAAAINAESAKLARFEEITRCASEVQDAMISILSEKTIAIPELKSEVPAKKGFSIIATANTRDKGVNDMSAALKRRFNIVVL